MGKKARERREKAKNTQLLRSFMAKARFYDWLKMEPQISSHQWFKQAVVIDANAVSDSMDSKRDELIGAVIPPYDLTFVEMGRITQQGGFPLGWLFAWMGDDVAQINEHNVPFEKSCNYLMTCILFGYNHKGDKFDVMGKWVIGLDEEYCTTEIIPWQFPYDSPEYIRSVAETGHDGMNVYNGLCVIGLKVLQLMNCHNITIIDVDIDEEWKALNQRIVNITGRSLVKYKILAIKSSAKREVDGIDGYIPLDMKALHLRRGNFAHYTDDAPLFGKYTGTFWRPATVVGNAKNGVVVKDYKVKPPDDE